MLSSAVRWLATRCYAITSKKPWTCAPGLTSMLSFMHDLAATLSLT